MKLHGDACAISLVFFGFACLVLGYLLFFVPAFVGELSLALWLIAKGVDRT